MKVKLKRRERDIILHALAVERRDWVATTGGSLRGPAWKRAQEHIDEIDAISEKIDKP